MSSIEKRRDRKQTGGFQRLEAAWTGPLLMGAGFSFEVRHLLCKHAVVAAAPPCEWTQCPGATNLEVLNFMLCICCY